MSILAIDPGESGGLALCNGDGIVDCYPMPDTHGDTLDLLRKIICENQHLIAYMERTGGYMPGNSGPAACKFARGCGLLEGLVMALGIPLVEVAPRTWMKSLGTLPKDKTARKNAIKALMQQRYPHLHITLKTADSLGILTWSLKQ